MITAFPLTEIDRIMRRTVIAAIIVGIVGAAVSVLLGQPYVAPGIAVGLALAVANHRVFQSSALRFTTPEGVVNRKPFAGSVALRLGACTAVAIGLMIVERPMGWGVIGGLAVFQALMLANALVALLQYQRREIGEAGAGDA
ncbi:MAG TPA: hypothetical protein VNF71_13845 [Acidimicrobiales bacterium]|nr:hypothetical protein [Acidimicrobiales bacterium]